MTKHTKVMSYQIIKPVGDSWDVLGQVLRVIQKEARTALNKTIQLCWEWDGFSADYKKKFSVYPNRMEVLGYTRAHGYAYHRLKDELFYTGTDKLSQTIRRAENRWKTDKDDIQRGDRSIPCFKRNPPIDVTANNFRSIRKNGKDYHLRLTLTSKAGAKKLERKDGVFEVVVGAEDRTKRIILDRLIEGKYKWGVSQIQYRKNKWFININYQFEKQEEPLDPHRIMGIDMGIVYPVYIAISDSPARYHIKGGEIDRFRRQVEQRRREMRKQRKYCGDGRCGHGRQTCLKPLDVLSEKVANFRDTTNHKYSRYIVELALKYRCAVIQLEDLQGIAKDDVFLKRWSYHDLQTKIEDKAREVGIQVIKVKPDYTSQRCSECGYISKENRTSQSEFRCVACGYEALADYNAARNLATKNIDQIIAQDKTRTQTGAIQRP